jgi:hypothetical protein
MGAFHHLHRIWIAKIFSIKTSRYYRLTLIMKMARIKTVLVAKNSA